MEKKRTAECMQDVVDGDVKNFGRRNDQRDSVAVGVILVPQEPTVGDVATPRLVLDLVPNILSELFDDETFGAIIDPTKHRFSVFRFVVVVVFPSSSSSSSFFFLLLLLWRKKCIGWFRFS